MLTYLHKNKTHLPYLLLVLLMTTYAIYFSWYSINRHNTLHSYAADLSLIDQPMWNTYQFLKTGHGFMELTWGQRQQPRLAEHFEPILILLSLLFFIWDDVRILLIAQSIALALGALPVFWIARRQLSTGIALIFALVYLLSPHLQAANVADFHADPFVVAPLLFAFWYATQKRWGWMWLWALVAMSVKETLPPLIIMLGIWRMSPNIITNCELPITDSDFVIRNSQFAIRTLAPSHSLTLANSPLSLIFVSIAWFFIATFGVVSPLAQQYFGTAGPIYFANRYFNEPSHWQNILTDPARWQYMGGLLASVGLLPLLAPNMLMLGLPMLIANLLSNFSAQYSGEQHYSAPLVAVFIIAAIYGSQRIGEWASLRMGEFASGRVCEWANGDSLTRKLADSQTRRLANSPLFRLVMLWLLAWSLGYHISHGWTPLSTRQEIYPMTTAAQLLPDFLAQIPPEAVVSASAAIHPHLAHRRVIYLFPTVQEADYLLVDVTDIPGVHPNDAHHQLMDLLQADWQILRAEQGLILAKKLSSPKKELPQLPDTFFDFARSSTYPPLPTPLVFGNGQLQLLGYEMHDDPANGVTFRFYWQSGAGKLPQELQLWPLLYDDWGQLLSDPTQVPMIAPLWYPPSKWQSHEIIVTETLPQRLPDIFHLGMAVGLRGGFYDPSKHWPIAPKNQLFEPSMQIGHWVQLATFWRQGTFLTAQPAQLTFQSLKPINASFSDKSAIINLTGFAISPNIPNKPISILLRWVATEPLPLNLTVFIHLLDQNGHLISQNDASPTWLFPMPTTQWPTNQPLLDRHTIQLPPDLPSGNYTLQVGLYDVTTMVRFTLSNGNNAFTLDEVENP